MNFTSNPLNVMSLVHVELIPLGFEGDYIFVQQEGPGPNCKRVFIIWSRWLDIVREKTEFQYHASDGRHIEKICENDHEFIN